MRSLVRCNCKPKMHAHTAKLHGHIIKLHAWWRKDSIKYLLNIMWPTMLQSTDKDLQVLYKRRFFNHSVIFHFIFFFKFYNTYHVYEITTVFISKHILLSFNISSFQYFKCYNIYHISNNYSYWVTNLKSQRFEIHTTYNAST